MNLQPLLDQIADERIRVTREASEADRTRQSRKARNLHGQAAGLSKAEAIVAKFMKAPTP